MSRPCYSAINQHATRGRPALVFVPTRKHARLVALDLLTFAASDADPHRFRLAEAADVEPFLARVKDPALKHALGFGVGIVTETMPEAERNVVDLLFESGAVQVGLIRFASKRIAAEEDLSLLPRGAAFLSQGFGDLGTKTLPPD